MSLATDILGQSANPVDYGDWWKRLDKDPLKEDYRKIAEFLREGMKNVGFRVALGKLNLALGAEIKRNVLNGTKEDAIAYIDRRGAALAAAPRNAAKGTQVGVITASQAYAAYAKSKDKKNGFSKLLSNVLAKHEKAEGFAGTVPTILKFLSPDQFRDLIKGGSQFKDPGAQSRHGEFTHRIHWYLICHGLKGLSAKPLEIFQAVGEYPEAGPIGDYQFTGLWDALFDRLEAQNTTYGFVAEGGAGAKGYGTDFRCPEWLNMYLVDKDAGGKRFPLLSSILRARMNKREFQAQIQPFKPPGKDLTENDSTSLQYLAHKFEKKMFLQLGDKQQAEMVDILVNFDSI